MADAPKVLVVEDDEHTRQLLRDLCESSGYQVVAVSDGPAALAAAFEGAPEAILLDLMLPRLDGMTVLERLKADERTRDIPVLLVTAVNNIEGRIRGIEAGADDYVTKPFRLFELQARLKTAVSARRVRQQLATAEQEIADLKSTDPLVGAGSFAQLKPSLDYELHRARRYGRPLACAMVGIEDAAARALGENDVERIRHAIVGALRQSLRGADRLFRLSGDEFLVLLPETDLVGARQAAARMVAAVAEESASSGLTLAAEAGVAVYPGATVTNGEDLLRSANLALDLARIKGPGTVGEP